MAKIRHIKVEFWTSPQIVKCSPLTRLLFIGMWNFCDDGGIHVFSTERLKMEIFPADHKILTDEYIEELPEEIRARYSSIEKMVDELEKNGLIKIYTINDEKYVKVTGWHHQKNYEKFFKYPDEDGIIPPNETYNRPVSGKGHKQKGNKQVTDCKQKGNSDSPDSQQTSHEHVMKCNEIKCNENEKDNARERASQPPSEILFKFKASTANAPIRRDYVDELLVSFPGIDVFYELGKMRQYLLDETKRRPSLRNIRGWIRKWLATAQEEATADAC